MDIKKFSKEELLRIIDSLTKENIVLKLSSSNDEKTNPLFINYLENWFETGKLLYNWQQTTIDGYSGIIKNHIIPYFKENKFRLRDILPSHIEAYYAYKMSDVCDRRINSNTIRRHNAIISKCLRSALKDGIIQDNPAKLVDLPKLNHSEEAYYDEEDLLKLFKCSRFTILYPVILLSSLGLRRSEALGVTWDNIDLVNKSINIRKKVVSTKNNSIFISSTLKTASSYRTISLPSFIASEFQFVYNRQCEQLQNNIERYRDEYKSFVCVDETGLLISPNRASEFLKKKILQPNNLKYINLKGLRHTCATLISKAGFNLKYIKEWLGHSTIQLTANTYTHVDMNDKICVAEKINEVFTKIR